MAAEDKHWRFYYLLVGLRWGGGREGELGAWHVNEIQREGLKIQCLVRIKEKQVDFGEP